MTRKIQRRGRPRRDSGLFSQGLGVFLERKDELLFALGNTEDLREYDLLSAKYRECLEIIEDCKKALKAGLRNQK